MSSPDFSRRAFIIHRESLLVIFCYLEQQHSVTLIFNLRNAIARCISS
ncbi:hypothetical protein [Gloeocapsopsis sp. IPPAS B-1203]|nr:hypothetical protein [Gloeocapsopsis sp. IPPAS B-1203]